MSGGATPYTAEEARDAAADWLKAGYQYTDPISRKRITATLRAYADQGERIERLRAALTDIRSRGLSARNGRAYDIGGIAHEALKEDDSHA